MVGSALVIMAKAPVPGEVKTRLCPPLSFDHAAELYSCMVRDRILQVIRFHELRVFLALPYAVDPEQAAKLACGLEVVTQRGEGLGERLQSSAEAVFRMGYSRVLLADSDSPTLPSHYISQALSMLQETPGQAVLGPTIDGGYYLIGLSAPCAELFRDIPWSTPSVLNCTLQRAAEAGVKVSLLPEWYDVDTGGDLIRLREDLRGPAASAAPRTAAWMAARRLPG